MMSKQNTTEERKLRWQYEFSLNPSNTTIGHDKQKDQKGSNEQFILYTITRQILLCLPKQENEPFGRERQNCKNWNYKGKAITFCGMGASTLGIE